jgi:excisionase family DNA binding protein
MPAGPISVADAASRLGVNQARVRAMIAAGLLDAAKVGGRWLVTPESVERRKARAQPVGRPFGHAMAWGILLVAVGERPDWLSPSNLSRIRRRLREQGLVALAPRLHARAVLHRLRAHPSDLNRIVADRTVVRTGVSAAQDHGLDLAATEEIEVYVREKKLAPLMRRHTLESSPRPNVLVRAVVGPWPFERGVHLAPPSVVGVDLLDSDDARTSRAGMRLLEQVEATWST